MTKRFVDMTPTELNTAKAQRTAILAAPDHAQYAAGLETVLQELQTINYIIENGPE